MKHILNLVHGVGANVEYLGAIDFDFPSGLYSAKDSPANVVIARSKEEIAAIGGKLVEDWISRYGDFELETEVEGVPVWWDEGALTLIKRASRLIDLGSFGPSASDFLEQQGFVTQSITDLAADSEAEYIILENIADSVAKYSLDIAFYESLNHTIWFIVPAEWTLPDEWISEDKMSPIA